MNKKRLTSSLLSAVLALSSSVAVSTITQVIQVTAESLTGSLPSTLDEGTYDISGSIEQTNPVSIKGSVTLNLDNAQISFANDSGKDYSSNYITVSDGASLTITGTGSISGTLNGSSSEEGFHGVITVLGTGSLEIGPGITVEVSALDGNYAYGIMVTGTKNSNEEAGTVLINGSTVIAKNGATAVEIGYYPGSNDKTANANVTIQNAMINASEGRYGVQACGATSHYSLAIINSEIYGGTDSAAVYTKGDGTASINGGTIQGGVGIETGNGRVTVTNNTTITGTARSDSAFGGSWGPTPAGAVISVIDTTYVLNGTTFDYQSGLGWVHLEDANVSSPAGTQNIYVIKGKEPVGQNDSDGPVYVYGGTYSSDPDKYLATSVEALVESKDANGNSTYGVYDSYDDAIANLKPGDQITNYENGQEAITNFSVTFIYGQGLADSTETNVKDPYLFPTITPPKVNGMEFVGWVDKDGKSIKPGDFISFPSGEYSMTFTAVWQKAPTPVGPGTDSGSTNNPGNGGSTNSPTPPTDESGSNNGYAGSGDGFTKPGSSTKPNTDGSSTTFTQEEDGTKSATTVDSEGNVTNVQVTIPSTGITDGVADVDLGTNSSGQKIKIPGNITDDASAPEVTVNLPQNADGTTVQFELKENTGLPGTVAMVEDENGNLIPIVDSVAVGNDFYVPVSGGKTQIIVKDNSKNFTDVASSAWYDDAIAFVSARDIMNGSVGEGSSTFNPDGILTRAMLAQMIANMDGQPNTSKDTNPWYLGAQRYVMGKGLMGVGSPFNPDDPITRQDLAVVLWRNAGSPQVSTEVLNEYKDRDQVSNYAIPAVAWAVENDIMGVNSPLNPTNDATRAEIAKMFMAYVIDLASK